MHEKGQKIINILLVIVGTISLCGGIVGIVFPIIPTIPFLLLTLTCYAKSSSKFVKWFTATRIYKKFLYPFITTHCMTNWDKFRVLFLVTIIISISIIFTNYLWLRIMFGTIILGHWIYFLGFIPSITKAELYRKLAEADDAKPA